MTIYDKFTLLSIIWDIIVGMGMMYFGMRVERYNARKKAEKEIEPKWFEPKEPRS